MNRNRLRPLSVFSEYQTEHPAHRELPYWEFLDGILVLADGTLVHGFSLQGLSIETLDSERINHLTTQIRSFLSSLPDGLEMSFVMEYHSNFETILKKHTTLATQSPVAAITQERALLLQKSADSKRLLTPSLYLYVYRRFATQDHAPGFSFFSSPKRFEAMSREVYESARRELLEQTSSIRANLESLGIKTTPLGEDAIWKHLYHFLNPDRAEGHPAPNLNKEYHTQEFTLAELTRVPALALPSPREQLLFSDFILGYDSFFCDGFHHRLITLKTLPEFTHSALVSRLSQLPFPHLLHVHLKVPEQSKELSQLQAKRRMAHSMSVSQGGRATDLESEARLHSTEELLRELIATGQKIFYFQLTVLIRAKTKTELETETKAVLSRIRELNGAEGCAETVGGFKVFKTILPMGNLTMVRPKRVKTDNLADFIPLYEPFSGPRDEESKPTCLFLNRSSGLVSYDPFDPSLPNYNTLVTGSSGSGKSFVNNLILLQYASQNPFIYIIDIGGSYRKLSEILDGQYIEISPAESSRTATPINPMELPEASVSPSPQKLKFLLGLLEMILTDEEGDKLHKLDKSLLEEAILSTYQRMEPKAPPRLSDLAETLKRSPHPGLTQFSKMLYPWTGSRPYGQLLDAPQALYLEKQFVVFDLKGLSAYPDLQAAMILIITDFILGRVDKAKGAPTRILMDEVWELLKHRGSSLFMEYCVRTLRKSGSGITFITQGLEEIMGSAIGPAILSNTATKFILMQRGDLEPTRKILKLNDQEMNLISSLKQSKGRYSEAFVVMNEDRTVIRICPTPLEYWIATSDAADNRLLQEARAKSPHLPLVEHLRELSKRYPFGVAGGRK